METSYIRDSQPLGKTGRRHWRRRCCAATRGLWRGRCVRSAAFAGLLGTSRFLGNRLCGLVILDGHPKSLSQSTSDRVQGCTIRECGHSVLASQLGALQARNINCAFPATCPTCGAFLLFHFDFQTSHWNLLFLLVAVTA